MSVEKKILEELKRFNQINSYLIKEQPEPTDSAVPPPPPADPSADPTAVPPPADPSAPAAPATPDAIPEPVDIENDPDVEEVDDEKTEDTESEEIDITDLVTTQQEMQSKQEEFMDGMFSKLDDLEAKLQNMDQIMDKINSLETKFDKYREKTPEEKLMLRSLDSYPYNQKLSDFFDDKKQEMEDSGKNEYILTSDDVENYSPNEVKKTFNIYDEEDNPI